MQDICAPNPLTKNNILKYSHIVPHNIVFVNFMTQISKSALMPFVTSIFNFSKNIPFIFFTLWNRNGDMGI